MRMEEWDEAGGDLSGVGKSRPTGPLREGAVKLQLIELLPGNREQSCPGEKNTASSPLQSRSPPCAPHRRRATPLQIVR